MTSRRNWPGTLARAYRLAVKHNLVDAADQAAVAEVLRCSARRALELTKDARDGRDQATKALAQQLHARGCTQDAIADKLGVTDRTVRRWLGHLREAPECPADAPALPSSETLDRIAADIKPAAKAEVKDEAAAEIKAEVEAIRKDFTPSERVAILQTIERKPEGNQFNSQNLASSATAAKLAGFGNRETARQATRVVERGTSELVAAMDNDEGRIIA